MFIMMIKTIFFITIVISIGLSELAEKNWDAVFGEELISSFEAQWKDATPLKRQEILSKTGKIAFYLRLYRAWIFTPAGKKGFTERFPEPKITVHPEIVQNCDKNLYVCIDAIYSSIQKRSEFLFPSRDQHMEHFNIDEESFRRYVSDSMFAYDVSVSYLMCFFTKNQLSFLKKLPFCSYGIEKDQKTIWPSSIFQDAANNPLILKTTSYEPIDDLNSKEDFTCADESFCPDPCCGRTTNRSTFCSHEICREQDIRRITLQHLQTTPSTNSSNDQPQQQQHSCRVDVKNNDNFLGLTLNKWNVSCNCRESDEYIFRFDTLQCVDLQECTSCDECNTEENEECINHIGRNSTCVCLQGYYRDEINNKCIEIEVQKSSWYGVAHAPPSSKASTFQSLNYFTSLFSIFCYCFIHTKRIITVFV